MSWCSEDRLWESSLLVFCGSQGPNSGHEDDGVEGQVGMMSITLLSANRLGIVGNEYNEV